jgi:hypothetical protein
VIVPAPESIPAELRRADDPALARVCDPDAALATLDAAGVDALLQRAAARGCATAYLQVDAANAAARRAYSKFGVRDGYAYGYREPPEEWTKR